MPAFFSFTLFDPESKPFRSEATLATEVLPCDSLLSSSKVFVCVAHRASFRRHVVLPACLLPTISQVCLLVR